LRAENASRVVKYANDNPLRFVDFSGFAAAEAQGKEAQLNTFLAREVDAGRMHKSQAILAGVFFRTKTVADIGGGAATTSANVLTVGGFGGVQRGTEEGRVTDLSSAARAFVEGNFTAIPGAEAALNAVTEGQGAGGALKAAAKDILAINEFGTVTDPTKSYGERAKAAFVGAIKVGTLILGGKKLLTGKAPTGVIAEGTEGKAALETVNGRRFAPGAASVDDPAFSKTIDELFAEGAPSSAGPGIASGEVRFKRWKRGEAIDKPLPEGTSPSWDVVRQRYWKNRYEASTNTGEFSAANLERMRRGSAPVDYNPRTGVFEERELHHVTGQQHGGPNTPLNLRELPPDWHAEVDPFRIREGVNARRGIR